MEKTAGTSLKKRWTPFEHSKICTLFKIDVLGFLELLFIVCCIKDVKLPYRPSIVCWWCSHQYKKLPGTPPTNHWMFDCKNWLVQPIWVSFSYTTQMVQPHKHMLKCLPSGTTWERGWSPPSGEQEEATTRRSTYPAHSQVWHCHSFAILQGFDFIVHLR